MKKVILLSLILCLPMVGFSQVTVIDTIWLEWGAEGVGVNPTTNQIYVGNRLNNDVSVLDGATDSVIATIGVGDGPIGVGVNPTTNRIYVANAYSDDVSVLDGATDLVIATIGVGDYPIGVGVNPTTNRIYVSCFDQGTVWVLQDETGIEETIPYVSIKEIMISPNPFYYCATIKYTTQRKTNVSIVIYNPTGRLVNTLLYCEKEPANHYITWWGKDDFGKTVPCGVYFLKFDAGEYSVTKKLLKVR